MVDSTASFESDSNSYFYSSENLEDKTLRVISNSSIILANIINNIPIYDPSYNFEVAINIVAAAEIQITNTQIFIDKIDRQMSNSLIARNLFFATDYIANKVGSFLDCNGISDISQMNSQRIRLKSQIQSLENILDLACVISLESQYENLNNAVYVAGFNRFIKTLSFAPKEFSLQTACEKFIEHHKLPIEPNSLMHDVKFMKKKFKSDEA